MSDYREFPLSVNGQTESIRFVDYSLQSNRQAYDLEPNTDLCIAQGDQLLEILIQFFKAGDEALLNEAGLWVIENPGKEEISRNLCVFHPESLAMYTLGGIGLIKLDRDKGELTLNTPELNDTYHRYQTSHGNNAGGTIYYTDKGMKEKDNDTPLGVVFYEKGPYNLVDKIASTNKLKEQGFQTPQYIAAGRILNLGSGEFGYSIYRTGLSPDYLANLRFYLDDTFNFKAQFDQYLEAKYQQLGKLHQSLSMVHGQPTLTNAEIELRRSDEGEVQIATILKDLATLRELPSATKKTITEGPCPQNSGMLVSKSPKVAAMVNDLQIALTQEFNILIIAISSFPKPDIKMKFLHHHYPRIMLKICQSYGLHSDQEINQIVNFSFNSFIKTLERGAKLEEANAILGGFSAHAMMGLSKAYADQIEIRPA